MQKAKIAIIGGTGFKNLLENTRQQRLQTRYGMCSPLYTGKISGRNIVFLPRHGPGHSIPPHKINYRANIYALHELSVERILATNAVGAINPSFKPGDIVVPHDFVDFTKLRSVTFCDKAPVTHIDVSYPYCPEIRKLLTETAEKLGLHAWDRAVLVCTEGPRYETTAEIKMFGHLGCDIVGMTGIPESVLARELEICYASICYISNMAAGLQKRLRAHEISEVSQMAIPRIEQILIRTIKTLPKDRDCICVNALEDARFEQ